MDLLSRYKRHDDLIQQGAILELGEGASAHIARMHDSNPQYKKVTEQLARQRQYELDNLKGQKKNTAYAEIAEEAFAQVCITKLTNIRIGGDVIEADRIQRMQRFLRAIRIPPAVGQCAELVEFGLAEIFCGSGIGHGVILSRRE